VDGKVLRRVDAYDFKRPKPGENGFHWSEIEPNWRSCGGVIDIDTPNRMEITMKTHPTTAQMIDVCSECAPKVWAVLKPKIEG
jgi:hypothetical protein